MSQPGSPILLDGGYGEGGGALVRTALSMAALTQQPMRLDNVRGGTNYPGLDWEDLLIIEALAESCAAETTGAEAGSTTMSFLPTRRVQALNKSLSARNAAGSRGPNALIVLQAILPVLARSGAYSRIEIQGQSHGTHELSFDPFANVTLKALRSMGIYARADLLTAGFGRESCGRVSIEIEPSEIDGINWPDRGTQTECRGVVTTSQLSASIVNRGIAHLKALAKNAGIELSVEATSIASDRPGLHISLWAAFERGIGGAAAMGSKGLRVENVAQKCFEELFAWLRTDATVDPYLADQILVAAALSENGCTFKTSCLTQRFLTSSWVIKQFLPIHLTIKGALDGPGLVTVRR